MTRRRYLAPPQKESVEPTRRPTMSVIVATYQAATTVRDALESVFAQTVPPQEVIVCDDGSTDEIEEAVAPYRDRITFLRKEHGGEASAKNAAIAAATGEFVVVLDADDVFFPERLEAIGDLAAERPDLDIITTDAYLEVDGTIVRRCYDARWTFAADDQRSELLRRNFVFGLAAVRRDLLRRHGGFDEAILWTTDWECWLRLVLGGARIGCLDEPLALYRVRETALSADRAAMTRGRIATLEKTRRDPRLSGEERHLVDGTLARLRGELALIAARDAVAGGEPAGRRQAAAVALTGRVSLRARVEALGMALAPALALRRLRRRNEESWVGAGGIRVARPRAESSNTTEQPR
jgi:GT2 family glycosyltransferase